MKKVFVLLLVLAMVMIPIPNIAEAQTNSKAKADLYISSARELNEFATKVNNGNDYAGKTIKLTKNIIYDSLTVNNFIPIGVFNGSFDGAGYSISNIDISNIDSSNSYTGLFKEIGENGVVKNVKLLSSSFTDKVGAYIGSIAGINYGLIDNCFSDINISVQGDGYGNWGSHYTVSFTQYVGGITGINYNKISNCINKSVITVNAYPSDSVNGSFSGYYGGLVGRNYAQVVNSYNLGSFMATSDGMTYLGGIVGYNDNLYKSANILNC